MIQRINAGGFLIDRFSARTPEGLFPLLFLFIPPAIQQEIKGNRKDSVIWLDTSLTEKYAVKGIDYFLIVRSAC